MKKRILAALLAAVLFLSVVPAAFAGELTAGQQLELLQEVDTLIREYGLESSMDDAPLDRALVALFRKAPDGEGLLDRLEADPTLYEQLLAVMLSGYDSHTMYLPAGTYSAAFGSESAYVGIGVTIQAHERGALVTDVSLSGPAFAAGVHLGDILTHADGQSLAGLTAADISQLLRGEAGTAVTLTVERDGQSLSFTLTRAAVTQSNYFGVPLEDGIFYMKWSRIQDDGSYLRFRIQLAQAAREGHQALILDLRDDPGGSLDLAFTLATDFMDEAKAFFRTRSRDPLGREELKTEYIISDGTGIRFPHLYVLVNESSASAAEIIAVGLRDAADAVLVGETTYGKGRAQQHYVLDTDAGIVLTTMMLLPLEGEDYEGVGITPEVTVTNTAPEAQKVERVPETTPLALYSCSDNGEALNRALLALGLLEELPEKPYQVTEETLAVCRRLEALYLVPGDENEPVGVDTLRLVNYLLGLLEQGQYIRDNQLAAALSLARAALSEE